MYILLQEKFSSLALAFQTDKLTLDRRKELHLRGRDVAEENVHRELEGLKDGMKVCICFEIFPSSILPLI